jgi:glycosyltransferase involved in cell wall biosynthesis
MPRIAHVISTPTGVGGAEKVMSALVAGGNRRGWDQIVLNPFAHDPHHAEIAALSDGARFGARRCSRPRELPRARAWLQRELDAFAPDIVHAHLFHAIVLLSSVRRTPGARWLLTHHHAGHLAVEERRMREAADRLAGARFDRVVAVSEWGRRLLVSRYRYPARTVALIPNGWEGHPQPLSDDHRPPTIICVANLRVEKGHDVLLSAFARVRERVPDARLVLVGDGERGSALRAQAQAQKLTDAVHFAGHSTDVWANLAHADVFALASRNEALGMAILEAMAARLPVVATAVGGVPEIVEPGITGELVPPGDDAGLAERLVPLLMDPEARRRMGLAGADAVRERTMEVTIRAYFDLYAELRGLAPRSVASTTGRA